MSPIALALDGLLAALLLLALVVGLRLNGRLKALRESHAGFARSVAELDAAALRAEHALASLRQAGEETHDSLLTRIDTARTLAAKLEALTTKAEATVIRAASVAQKTTPLVRERAVAPVPRRRLDLDLFEPVRITGGESGRSLNPSARLTGRSAPEDELFADAADAADDFALPSGAGHAGLAKLIGLTSSERR